MEGSFYATFLYFWNEVIKEPYVHSEHIEVLCNECQKAYNAFCRNESYDLDVNVPPGTSKSTVFAIMYPVWLWIQDPSIKICTVSYSSRLANDHTMKSRDVILSDRFRALFPEIELRHDRNQISTYQNNQGGLRFATSTGGSVTGMHFHVIIPDDMLSVKMAHSESERTAGTRFFFETLSSRKVDKQRSYFANVQQRLHTDDLSGVLSKRKSKRLKHICLPAQLSDNVQPNEFKALYTAGYLDPIRLGKEVLNEIRKDGEYLFASQYMQDPISDGISLFKRVNNRHCRVESGYIVAGDGILDLKRIEVFFTVDLAVTAKETADYTVLSVWACDKQSNLYLIDCFREQIQGAEHEQIIKQYRSKWNPNVIGIESVSYQKALVQSLANKGMPVIALKPDKDKFSRALVAAARHEQGKIYLNSNIAGIEAIEAELNAFPNARHDDFVDTLAYAVNHITNINFDKRQINHNLY